MKKLVLLVDDDKLPMRYYIKALRQNGFKVQQCFEPDSALAFARKKATEIACIILDIMMPPGKTYEKYDTKQGLITGVLLFEDLRKKDCCPDTPVVILTNVKNPKTIDKFKNKYLLQIHQKMNCPPFELAELVEEIVKQHQS